MRFLSTFPFIVILSTSTLAQADGFDFKGVAFGSSVEALKEKYPDYHCIIKKDSPFADEMCLLLATTFAGVPADISLNFYEDKLGMAHARVAPSDFSQVITALREKYGKPSSIKTEPVTNRMGAMFENQILEWKKSGTTIRAEKYSTSLDNSSVGIFADFYPTELRKRMDTNAAQRAKDL